MQVSKVWRFYWPIKGRSALVAVAEAVAAVAVAVLPMEVSVGGTCNCIPDERVVNSKAGKVINEKSKSQKLSQLNAAGET